MAGADAAWRCTVCGYIHRGPEPPDICPVCGAPKDAFEEHVEQVRRPARPRVTKWRCLICSYVHTGSEPPDQCPVCGAHRDRFEPIGGEAEKVREAARPKKVVIIGAGIAGVSAAESLRAASPSAEITLVSKESHLPYYRLNLTRFVAGEIGEEDLPIHPESWYRENSIRLMPGVEATSLDLQGRTVACSGGESLRYDKLLLAAGAHPFVPPFPGAYREGVVRLRTLEDARLLLDQISPGKVCLVIGGGVLGLETAAGLAHRGADATLLEGYRWLIPRQLNEPAGELLAAFVAGRGVMLRMNAQVEEILGDERVRAVRLKDGDVYSTDLVVITTGIRPNSYLARTAGLDVNQGIVIDDLLATTHPDVFAAGDVAEHRGVVYGLWGPAQSQGSVAGMNLAGVRAEFAGMPQATTLKVVGLDVFSVGQFTPGDASYLTVEQRDDGRYSLFVFRDGHMVGAILAGDTGASTLVQKAVEKRLNLSELLDKHPAADDVTEFLRQRSA
jgi:nitrite reductase (NADH) large subunit